MKARSALPQGRGDAALVLTDAIDALENVHSQIDALCTALLRLMPPREQTRSLPIELRRDLDAARVLVELSLHHQADQLPDWVGQHLDELAALLKGGAA